MPQSLLAVAWTSPSFAARVPVGYLIGVSNPALEREKPCAHPKKWQDRPLDVGVSREEHRTVPQGTLRSRAERKDLIRSVPSPRGHLFAGRTQEGEVTSDRRHTHVEYRRQVNDPRCSPLVGCLRQESHDANPTTL